MNLGIELWPYRLRQLRKMWEEMDPVKKVEIVLPQLYPNLLKARGNLVLIIIESDRKYLPSHSLERIGPIYIPEKEREVRAVFENLARSLWHTLDSYPRMYKIEFDPKGIKKVYSPYLTVATVNIIHTDDPYYKELVYTPVYKKK